MTQASINELRSIASASNDTALCSACSSELAPNKNGIGFSCEACGGYHGTMNISQLPFSLAFDTERDVKPEEMRYFDVKVWDGAEFFAARRVHGWYNVTTGRVVQFG